MTLAAHSFAAAINHLLAREPWAREQLLPYAGKTAKLAVPGLELALQVRDDGLLEACAEGTQPPAFDVTISASSDALPAFLQGGQAAAMKHVRIAGDAEFAASIARLAEHLRWEPEEDLATVLGDAPAHQLAQGARAAYTQLRRSGRNLLEAAVEYWLDEDPQLVRRVQLQQMSDELVTLRDALARLEKRTARLERALPQRAAAMPTASGSGLAARPTGRTSQIDSDDGVPPSDRSR